MHSSMHALPEVVKCMKTIGFLGRRWQTFWKMCTPPTHFLGRRRSFFRKLKVSHSLKQIHVFQGNAWEGCTSSTTSANVFQENLWFSNTSLPQAMRACWNAWKINVLPWKMLADIVEDVKQIRKYANVRNCTLHKVLQAAEASEGQLQLHQETHVFNPWRCVPHIP